MTASNLQSEYLFHSFRIEHHMHSNKIRHKPNITLYYLQCACSKKIGTKNIKGNSVCVDSILIRIFTFSIDVCISNTKSKIK